MTTEELARKLREIEVSDFTVPELNEHESYDAIPPELKEMYMKMAATYLKYFDMELKKS